MPLGRMAEGELRTGMRRLNGGTAIGWDKICRDHRTPARFGGRTTGPIEFSNFAEHAFRRDEARGEINGSNHSGQGVARSHADCVRGYPPNPYVLDTAEVPVAKEGKPLWAKVFSSGGAER